MAQDICGEVDKTFNELYKSPNQLLLQRLLDGVGIEYGVPRYVRAYSCGEDGYDGEEKCIYFITSYGDGRVRYANGRLNFRLDPSWDNVIRIRKKCNTVTIEITPERLEREIEERMDKRRREAVAEALNIAKNLVHTSEAIVSKLLDMFGIRFSDDYKFKVRSMRFAPEGVKDLMRTESYENLMQTIKCMNYIIDVIHNDEHVGKVEITMIKDVIKESLYPKYILIGFFNGKEINIDIVPVVDIPIYNFDIIDTGKILKAIKEKKERLKDMSYDLEEHIDMLYTELDDTEDEEEKMAIEELIDEEQEEYYKIAEELARLEELEEKLRKGEELDDKLKKELEELIEELEDDARDGIDNE